MWLSAIKLAVSAGSKIYANKQRAKVAMSDAQLLHAERQARGEEAYQGKLLEARQTDYKDEVILAILTLPILVLAYGVWSEDPAAMDKMNISRHCRHGLQIYGFLSWRAFLELKELRSSGTVEAKNNG
jgi:uncharacterized ion transporter superfamily protein YfcC